MRWAHPGLELGSAGEDRDRDLRARRRADYAHDAHEAKCHAALVGASREHDEIPDALVSTEMERRLRGLSHRLSHQGVDMAAFLETLGDQQEEFVAQLRVEATNAVKADLALRAVAEMEGVDASDEEVDQEIVDIARQRKMSPAAVRKELENEDQLPAVRSGIRKTKALEWLIAHTEFVDEEGQVIDRSQLAPPSFDSPESDAEAAAPAEETE
jgi:FKBP-type peptidyl-prolyl cis-trans isomerase (trigger factor)